MNKKWLALAALGLSAAVAGPAMAGTVSWLATGDLDFVGGPNVPAWLDDSGTFAFQFSFENPSAGTTALNGTTYPLSSLTAASVTLYDSTHVNSYTFNLGAADGNDTLRLRNGIFSDGLEVIGQTPNVRASWNLIGSNSLLASASLSDLPPSLSGLSANLFTLLLGGSSTFGPAAIAGHVDAVAPVPLPAAAWLLLSGLGALGMFARRRRQQPVGVAASA